MVLGIIFWGSGSLDTEDSISSFLVVSMVVFSVVVVVIKMRVQFLNQLF